jgi:hypothetical protein
MTPDEAADIARAVLGDRAAEVVVDEGGLHIVFPVAPTDYDVERGAEVELEVVEEAVVALEEVCAKDGALKKMKIVVSLEVRE